MQKLKEHIGIINNKLQELLKKQAVLVKDAEIQLKTIARLEKEKELMDARLKLLEQQQHILKAAAGKMEELDKKVFEQVISKYIREIDKCINLLND